MDSGGDNCQTNENYPCRTAKAAQIIVSHVGMTCAATTISGMNYDMVIVTTALTAAIIRFAS